MNNIGYTENGATTYLTSGKELIDQFGHAGTAIGRPIETVFSEQEAIWNENPVMALRFPFYLRLITRKIKVSENAKTDSIQKGAGLKDESLKRLLWIAKYHPNVFEKNIWLLPVVGSWKDLWTLMCMGFEYHIQLDHALIFGVMAAALDDSTQCDLVRKYMPAIRSNSKCTTARAKALNALAKAFADFMGLTAKEYRKMKASGTAHDFQKLICSRRYADIDWKNIPGRALTSLITGKFLENHGLMESYLKWVMDQPTVKYTGYVHELGKKLGDALGRYSSGMYQKKIAAATQLATIYTINKQFDGLIETAKKDQGGLKGNVLCALDTSGSMTSPIQGANGITSYDVCVALGIYFAELNEGYYHNKVAMFDDTSKIMKLSGTFSDKWTAIRDAETAWGSTNVLSLIRLLIDERVKHPDVPISEYPNTILVVSDMQFNKTYRYDYQKEREQTTYEAMQDMFRAYFPNEWVDNLKIVWWYCASREGAGDDVPATMDSTGMYLVSGFDGAIITTILGGEVDEKTGKMKPKSMEEAVVEALSQEIFSFVR